MEEILKNLDLWLALAQKAATLAVVVGGVLAGTRWGRKARLDEKAKRLQMLVDAAEQAVHAVEQRWRKLPKNEENAMWRRDEALVGATKLLPGETTEEEHARLAELVEAAVGRMNVARGRKRTSAT